jgi:NADPH:quinone reductase-like Zn-dependent oxidoreductase
MEVSNMRAIVYERYGPPEVLELKQVDKPAPKMGEVLIKIHATTVHIGDVRMRIPDPFLARLVNGLLRPRKIPILGMELAGEVEAVGQSVERFKPGDRVFAFTGFGFGAYAEYICLPEHGTTKNGLVEYMPENLSYAQAAALPGGGMTALTLIEKAQLQPGQKILIYGASGSIGSFAVQLAKHRGAEVTGVCSGASLELVRSLGADHVLDYAREDFATDRRRYDVVLDAVHKLDRGQGKRALKEGGIYLDAHKDSDSDAKTGEEAMRQLGELAEAGVLTPVIDRTYALEDIVEAHRYVEAGHKKGNVVIAVIPAGS